MRRFSVDLNGHAGYAYLGLDMDSHNMQEKKISLQALNDKMSFEEINKKMRKLGSFVIVSSRKIECKDILPLYYTRVQIEQVFDIAKNNADLVPLRIHGEETLKGHLILTFLSSFYRKIYYCIHKRKIRYTLKAAFLCSGTRNAKCTMRLLFPKNPQRR